MKAILALAALVINRRQTLAEQAYDELQSQILSGELAAGQRLFPDELAGKLSISPTPVKEALTLLERDGLVDSASRRASVVRRFTAADIIEIYQARTLIELSAVTVGFREKLITPALLDELDSILARHYAHAIARGPDDLAEALRLDRLFHRKLVALAHNRLYMEWHQTVVFQTQTVRAYDFETYDAEITRVGHDEIMAALRSMRLREITGALGRHLTTSRNSVLARKPEDLPPCP